MLSEELVKQLKAEPPGKPDISLPSGFGIWPRSSDGIFSGQGQQVQ